MGGEDVDVSREVEPMISRFPTLLFWCSGSESVVTLDGICLWSFDQLNISV